MFKSTNGGTNWTATGFTNGGGVEGLAIDPRTPSTLYVESSGVWQSTNGGSTWNGTVFPGLPIFDPTTPSTLYAGSFGAGVFQSTNSGASWRAINAGLSNLYVRRLAISPARPSTLYAGTEYGVFDLELTCVVGTSTSASCTEPALDACLPGGAGFTGAVTFDCGGPATVTVSSTKAISADTTIDGGSLITISGGNSVGVFSVNAGITFTVRNLTIANGSAPDGGGIRSEGTLTVTNSTFSDNSATLFNGGGNGGGIWNVGTLTVTNSTFSGNSAPTDGGGIWNLGTLTVTNSTFSANSARDGGGIAGEGDGTVTVTSSTFSGNSASGFSGGGAIWSNGTLNMSNSTFSGNSATGGGGAIHNSGTLTVTNSTFWGNTGKGEGGAGGAIYSGGTLTVTNSTFSGNSALCHFVPIPACVGSDGGAIANAGTLTVTNSTFSGNSATGAGGAVDNTTTCGDSGSAPCSATLRNTIVANSTSGGDCAGTITDGGHNLDSDGTCGVGLVVDPLLDSAGLADNGGPTQTIALQAHSPAINACDETICTAPPVNKLDQRGFVRPGTGATRCSIGAYEFDSPGPPSCNVGDCNNDGQVTIDELLTLANMALGNAQPSVCPHGAPGGTEVGIALILQAVNNALTGCGG